jgi:small subunit ribosomal protein S5
MINEQEKKEFTERVLEINRVTRVVKGGKRLRFRTLMVVGNRKGKVSLGMGKAGDVSQSIAKALEKAYRNMHSIFMTPVGSLPYPVVGKFKKAHVLIKPAPQGTGIIAGGAVRLVLELAGLKDVVSKSLGSGDKISNAQATILALSHIVDPKVLRARRGKKALEASLADKTEIKKENSKPAVKKNRKRKET